MRPMNIVRAEDRNPCLQHAAKDHQSGGGDEQEHMAAHLERAMSRGLKQALAELVNGTGPLPFRQLRQSARNFTGTELERTDCLSPYPALDAGSGSAVEHAITVAEKSATPGRKSTTTVPN